MGVTHCKKCLISTSNNFTPCFRDKDEGHILFIGEAPGTTENRLKQPFVGKAGLKLKEFLKYYHLEELSVLTNMIKCQPPRNRDPHSDEIINCRDFLLDDLRVVKPKLIILVGRVSIESFTNKEYTFVKDAINKPFFVDKTIVIGIYHPSYILRNNFDDLYFISFNIISEIYSALNPYYNKKHFKPSK